MYLGCSASDLSHTRIWEEWDRNLQHKTQKFLLEISELRVDINFWSKVSQRYTLSSTQKKRFSFQNSFFMCLGNQNSKFCVRNMFLSSKSTKTQCRSTKKQFQVLKTFFELKKILSFQDFLPKYGYLLWERISRVQTFFHLNFRSISRLSEINILVRQKYESLKPNLAQNIIPGVPICFAVFLIPNWIIWTTSHTRNAQHLIFTHLVDLDALQVLREICLRSGYRVDLADMNPCGQLGHWFRYSEHVFRVFWSKHTILKLSTPCQSTNEWQIGSNQLWCWTP